MLKRLHELDNSQGETNKVQDQKVWWEPSGNKDSGPIVPDLTFQGKHGGKHSAFKMCVLCPVICFLLNMGKETCS